MRKKQIGLRPDIFSWGNAKPSHDYTCMYCGRPGNSNPSDYGLHFNDEDVFADKYVCGLCDVMITQSNRMFKSILEDLEENHFANAKHHIEMLITTLTDIHDNLEEYVTSANRHQIYRHKKEGK